MLCFQLLGAFPMNPSQGAIWWARHTRNGRRSPGTKSQLFSNLVSWSWVNIKLKTMGSKRIMGFTINEMYLEYIHKNMECMSNIFGICAKYICVCIYIYIYVWNSCEIKYTLYYIYVECISVFIFIYIWTAYVMGCKGNYIYMYVCMYIEFVE